MENMSNETLDILNILNDLENCWKSLFDEAPKNFSVVFSVDPSGDLLINGTALCPVSDIDAETCAPFFDCDHIGFYCSSGARCQINIDWPYEGTPKLKTAQFVIRELSFA